MLVVATLLISGYKLKDGVRELCAAFSYDIGAHRVLVLAGLVLGITVLPIPVALFGGCLLAASIPSSMIFLNYARAGQIVFGTIALFAVVTGFIQLVEWAVPNDTLSALSGVLFPITVLSVVLCTWFSGVPGLTRRSAH